MALNTHMRMTSMTSQTATHIAEQAVSFATAEAPGPLCRAVGARHLGCTTYDTRVARVLQLRPFSIDSPWNENRRPGNQLITWPFLLGTLWHASTSIGSVTQAAARRQACAKLPLPVPADVIVAHTQLLSDSAPWPTFQLTRMRDQRRYWFCLNKASPAAARVRGHEQTQRLRHRRCDLSSHWHQGLHQPGQ